MNCQAQNVTRDKRKNGNLANGKKLLLAASLSGLSLMYHQKAADGATDVWLGNNSANFSNGGWTGNSPPVSGDALVFDVAGTAGTSLNDDLDSSTIFSSFTFNASAPSYNISGNSISLGTSTPGTVITSIAGAADQTISTPIVLGDSAQTFSLAGNLSTAAIQGAGDSSALIKTGPGTLTLNYPSSYNGGTTLSGGTTLISNNGALGSGNVTLAGGTLQTVDYTSASVSFPISIQPGTTSTIGAGYYSNFTFYGNITGSGSLNVAGRYNINEIHFDGDDSGFTGNFIVSGVNVRLDTASSGSASATFTINSGAGLQLYGAAGTIYSFGGLAGTGAVGTADANSATISVGNSANSSFGGSIVDVESFGDNDGNVGTLSLIKVGTGTQILTGTSTFSGSTTISAGTLQLGDGTTDGSFSGTGGIINSGTLAYNWANSHNVRYAISGTGNVTKAGPGALTFTTSQGYTGPTAINGGSIKLTSGFSYSTSAITVGASGTLSTAGKVGVATVLGSVVQSTGGAIDLRDGVISSLSIGNGLALASGTLGFDVGTTADSINLTGGSYSATGTDNVFLNNIGGVSATTYNLIANAPGINLANFSLQTATVGGLNASLSILGGNTLELTLANVSGTSSAYWNTKTGNFAAANFSQTNAGTGAVTTIDGTTPVVFSSDPENGLGAKVASLTANQSIKSLLVSDSSSVTLNGAFTLTVADSSGITVNSGAGPVTINTSGLALGASQFWTNGSTNPVVVSSVISGAGDNLTFEGGTFVLSGSNTYTGSTTVNADGVLQLGSGTLGNDGSISGTTSLADFGAVTYDTFNSSTVAYVISGSGSVTKSGAGTLSLSSSNTYSGGTTINGGTVAINTDASIGDEASPLIINSGTLESTATITSTRSISVGSSSSTILVDSGAAYTANGVVSGSGILNKTGAGSLTLNGSNTYSGGSNLSAGTTFVSNGSALGTGTLTLSGGTLQMANDIGYADFTNPISVQAGTTSSILPGHYDYFEFDGNITGRGTLNVSAVLNTNEIHFDGDNSGFTGNFIVSGANVRLDTATSGSANATFTINSGAGLELYGAATYNFGGLAGTGDLGTGNGVSATISVGNSANSSFGGSIVDVDPVGNSGAGGTISFTKVGTGTQTLTGTNTYSGPTAVTAGTLAITSTAALPSNTTLSISAGATFAEAKGSSTYAVVYSSLTNNGTIDLQNNAAVFSGSTTTLAAIAAEVAAGFNGGAWNGSNSSIGTITSSTAAADSKHLTALGVIVNDSTGTAGSGSAIYSSFDGSPTSDGDILVKYTYYGDANLDGTVDGSDYTRIDYAYLNNRMSGKAALTGWFNGDFNYDGVVDGSDYTLIDNAFNTEGASLAAQFASSTAQIAGVTSSVPEPATLGLLGMGVVGLLARRRRLDRVC